MSVREHKCRVPTAQIKRLHARGLSCPEIGRLVGLAARTVHRRLWRRGIRRSNAATARYDTATLERAVHLYRFGLGLRPVARFLKLKCPKSAARVLRAAGVVIR